MTPSCVLLEDENAPKYPGGQQQPRRGVNSEDSRQEALEMDRRMKPPPNPHPPPSHSLICPLFSPTVYIPSADTGGGLFALLMESRGGVKEVAGCYLDRAAAKVNLRAGFK